MPARSKRRHKVVKKCKSRPCIFCSKGGLLLPPLLREHFARNGEHSLEALATLSRVLAEPVNGDLFDAVLNLLPATAHGNDLGGLVENRPTRGIGGSVTDGFLH